ncbi:MAG: pyruvate phosphate dikinase PEP/pyruvate-binding protein [Deltaproteobacteria bacterium]|nr:pyruvate phosphate dikinase PEP/pyruvate-binding protein [Deltaproteobacteria bacterium]
MDNIESSFKSSALEINLERTRAIVEIPEKYKVLMEMMQEHYGILRRLEDLLIELNHPFVNWDYVLTQVKSLSIGDFYDFNRHENGLQALRLLSEIYMSTIFSSRDENVQDSAVRYLFEFINTMLGKSQDKRERNRELVFSIFSSLLTYAQKGEHPFLRKSSTYLKITLGFFKGEACSLDGSILRDLLYRTFRSTYDFWMTQPDPTDWFDSDGNEVEARTEFKKIVDPLSHVYIAQLLDRLEVLHQNVTSQTDSQIWGYLDIPDYFQIVNGYMLVADDLERSEAFADRRFLIKLDFLFRVLNVPGLVDIHASALIEINRCLGKVFGQTGGQDLNEFIKKVFGSMKRTGRGGKHQSKIIDCITTLAKGVFDQNDHPLVDSFIEELIAFGFQYPDIEGSTDEWQIRSNPSHIENIRSWLRIIGFRPRWTKRLLSALVINLERKGVFVKDTDLFQKEISAFLNSDITPSYNLAKQLLRLFPIFFTEIGAEGELRETSTNVDELSSRNDKLIFYLRKQSHVESNSLLVPFTEDIFRYWATGDRSFIKPHLPQEVFDQVHSEGEFFDDLHIAFKSLLMRAKDDPRNFLEWDSARILKEVKGVRKISEKERERARLILRYYQLIYKKYNHQHIDLLRDLEISCMLEIPKIQSLKRALKKKDHYSALSITLDMLVSLKGKILSPVKTDYFENIYHKRHIAAGIPSMYGTYREEKFEAMGLTFRLESLATMLFDKLVQSLNLKFITKSTLMKIHKYLWLYVKALDVDGIATEGLVSKMRYITSALQIRQFSIDQYIDIFQFISKQIQDIIRDYYIDTHAQNLPVIIGQMTAGKGAGEEGQSIQEIIYRYSENFIRSIIATAFGLQVFDNFINSIIRALGQEVEKFKDNRQILNLVMAYIPELTISPIYKKMKEIDNQVLIGNKGYFLKEMASLGFPVPPGFIITTEVFRGYEAVVGYKYIFKDLSARIFSEIQSLEHVTGKKYGNPRNPLLLSVRSGATISLPGMMHSFLNVGLNETIAEGLSRNPEYRWAAWDSYRRFLQTWGMFQGLERNIFDEIMNSYKLKFGVTKKIQFQPDEMRQLALSYKQAMEDRDIIISNDPQKQLQDAIMLVFASWDSQQAKIYRHQMHVSDEWGTAVIVQAMVFGNLNENSGSGVIFTREPRGSSQNVALYGDFIFGVQGDDIVSGLVETYPISEKQRVSEMRESMISLQKRFPEIYAELVRVSEFLVYEKRFNHQEIEFTFESSSPKGLYILQTRDMVQRGAGKVLSFRDSPELARSLLGIGIGVSGGALTGRVVYSEEEIAKYRKENTKEPLILIRPDTVPDDVGIILKVEGILTARGGGTSHAAVTIPQLNKVGVVGFSKLHVYENEAFSQCENQIIRGGDFISIDGWTGAVYFGKHDIEEEESYKITL